MTALTPSAAAERADVLAYLRQRMRAATTVAANNLDERDRATDMARAIGIQIEFIEQGLHEGAQTRWAAIVGESTDGQ
jgi:hypothetical protein